MIGNNILPWVLALATFNIPTAIGHGTKRPNVVFILTDDQDAQMNSLDYMPIVQEQLVQKGTNYRKHYCTVALCCPSRVNLWTGQTAHNTNVTDVTPPYGGYPKFIDRGLNDKYLPVWLQEAGYSTYYTGKLFNAHTICNYNNPYPRGFNGTDFLVDPGTYEYLSPIFQRNQDAPIRHKEEYNTDLIAQKGLGFIDDAAKSGEPFFVTFAPIGPHANFHITPSTEEGGPVTIDSIPPIPANRHANLFANVSVPRTANFNPDTPSGADWISLLPKLSAENITWNDHWYRERLRSLQAVDEIVGQVIARLKDYGILDNTYIVYSSDNGYHISQHRLPPGKGCGFEEDINVPLVIRGPNVPAGEVVDLATSHTDLAPTFFSLLDIPLRDDFDGVPIPVTRQAIETMKHSGKAKEHVQVEFWSYGTQSEYTEDFARATVVNNTYKGLRVVAEDYGFYYAAWCAGGHQLYDMKTDPYQVNNLFNMTGADFSSPSTSTYISLAGTSYPLSTLTTRLNALLMVLKTCKATSCYDPWSSLLPNEGVASLGQAMASRFDAFFEGLPRVEYGRCEPGYITEAEGAVWEGRWSWRYAGGDGGGLGLGGIGCEGVGVLG